MNHSKMSWPALLGLSVLMSCGGGGSSGRTKGADGPIASLAQTDPRNVPVTGPIRIRFSMDMDPGSIHEGTIRLLARPPGLIRLRITYSDRTVVVTPLSRLQHGESYTLVVSRDVRSVAGVAPSQEFRFELETEPRAAAAPKLVQSAPGAGATVDPVSEVTFTFDQPMDPSSFHAGSCVVARSGGGQVPGRYLGIGTTLRFVPDSRLTKSGTYTVNLTTAVRGANGREVFRPTQFDFEVRANSGTWSDAETVATGLKQDPWNETIDTARGGVVAFAYEKRHDLGPQNEVYACVRMPDGMWHGPFRLGPSTVYSGRRVRVSINSKGQCLAVWDQQLAERSFALCARIFGGNRWSDITVLAKHDKDHEVMAATPQIHESGTAGVMWTTRAGHLMSRTRVAGKWGAARTLSTTVIQDHESWDEVREDAMGNRVLLARDFSGPGTSVSVVHFDGTMGFRTPRKVLTTTGRFRSQIEYFHMTGSGKALLVATFDGVHHYNFFDGSSWLPGGTAKLVDEPIYSEWKTFAMGESGDAVLIRGVENARRWQARSRRFLAKTGKWQAEQPLADTDVLHDRAFIPTGDCSTELVCLWERETNDGAKSVFARYDFERGAWGAMEPWDASRPTLYPRTLVGAMRRYGNGNAVGLNNGATFQMARYLRGVGWMAQSEALPRPTPDVLRTSIDGRVHAIAVHADSSGPYTYSIVYRQLR